MSKINQSLDKFYSTQLNEKEVEMLSATLARFLNSYVENRDKFSLDQWLENQIQKELPNVDINNITVECYYGKILDNGIVENVSIIPMTLSDSDEDERKYYFTTKIELTTGGNYGYTFRVMPKHEMLLEPANMNLIKWITK